MPAVGWDTLQVRKETKQRLRSVYESKKHEMLDKGVNTFNGFVQEILSDYLEINEELARYGPYLSQDAVELDRIVLHDAKVNASVDVYLRDHSLYCDYDKSTDCVHVAFAWRLPTIYESLKAKGLKPPHKQ